MFQQVQLLIHQPLNIIVDDNASLVCPLAGKIIQGIARHLFIVSHRWLNECLSQESIVDERPYEIRGVTSLGCDHGGMRRSLHFHMEYVYVAHLITIQEIALIGVFIT
jgi:hypothetical protein